MPTAAHKAGVALVLESFPGAKTHGFKREIRESIRRINHEWWAEEDDEAVHEDIHVVPDAFLIDEASGLVVVWEVEDTYRLNPTKYVPVFWRLDSLSLDLLVVRVDARTMRATPLDIAAIVLNEQF